MHLYSCPRLPALIWSLPYFQVQVVMFSVLGFLSPKCLVNSTWGGEMSPLLQSLWTIVIWTQACLLGFSFFKWLWSGLAPLSLWDFCPYKGLPSPSILKTGWSLIWKIPTFEEPTRWWLFMFCPSLCIWKMSSAMNQEETEKSQIDYSPELRKDSSKGHRMP